VKKKPGTRRSIGLSRRSYAGLPATIDVDARSFPIIIATEPPVETMIPDPDKPDVEGAMILVAEVLPVAGFDDSRVPGMPLMDILLSPKSSIRSPLGKPWTTSSPSSACPPSSPWRRSVLA
jgi:hypothetical protein